MAKKKVEEVTEKEEVVKEKKTRTKKEAEPKEEKVKRTRTKKVKEEEPKEEIVEAEKVVIKEEEKAEAIEMVENTTTLALFNADEVEILKQMITEYRLKTNNTRNNDNTTNNNAKNFFENIEIPNEVRKVEYNTTLSIRGKSEIYEKIKEVAKKNGITASLLVNYLFYLVLKPLGEWEKVK